jgi:ABC-type transporter Mla maintaining outer membrane lipid asymmetry permease subunit MlaE
MFRTSPRFAALCVVLSVIVAVGMVYGLFGEQMGLRTVYHSPIGASEPATK